MAPKNANIPGSDYHFILNCYSANDIGAVIKDFKLQMEGYELLYAIDMYDIMEKYLPYIKPDLFSNTDRNYQAQRMICYKYFFSELTNTPVFLVKEYNVELIAAKNKIRKHLRDATIVFQNLMQLKKETNNFLNDPEKTVVFIRDNFEVLLILLMLNSSAKTEFHDFFDFLHKRLFISEIKTENSQHQETLNQILEDSHYTHFFVKIFEKYIDMNKYALLSLSDPEDRHIFLENTFRDTQVIEKLLNINEQIRKRKMKYAVCYLSSAKKTNDIFKAIENYGSFDYPFLHFDQRNINRNIYQYFLLDRLKKEFGSNPEKALEILEKLRDLLAKIESATGHNAARPVELEKETIQLAKILFDDKLSNLDNHFYYNLYQRYKSAFGEITYNQYAAISEHEIKKIVTEIDESIDGKSLSKINSLEVTLSLLEQRLVMVDTFIGAEEYDPEYRFGRDIIRNPYQHLPNIPLIHDRFDSPLKDKIYAFLDLSAEIPGAAIQQLKDSFKDIVDELALIKTDNLETHFLKYVMTAYLTFVGQSKLKIPKEIKVENYYPEIEESLILELEGLYERINSQYLKSDPDSIHKNQLEFYQSKPELLSEIIYMLLWLYRRSLQEDKGIQKAIKNHHIHHNDPRILQGIALCYISKAYQSLSDGASMEYTDKAIDYLAAARDKYRQLILEQPGKDKFYLVTRNYIAILNSIADMHVKKYLLDPESKRNEDLISTGRRCIDEIKMLYKDIQLDYDTHPVYSLTEIEIEYYEALHYYNKGIMGEAHKKIFSAIFRVKKVKEIPEVNKYYADILEKGVSHLYELSNKVIHHNKR
ncbi:hypothetical protein AAHN97_16020 [Chitinophaga niabensis]|uniref:hypothetical protein n=1 Tax=Chitinophaga niabensis TaxID=536979 RepID=UPI0031BB2D6F